MSRLRPAPPSSIALMDIYERMLSAYGPQHWWPGESSLEVIIGAILTQSASWTNVEKAIDNLKNNGALSIQGLQRLPVSDLARLVYPSGYYNAKAAKIKAFVDWLYRNHDADLDNLFSLDTAELRQQLLGVYGIGEETADSIVLYAASKPMFVIDAYTRRIIDRLGTTWGVQTPATGTPGSLPGADHGQETSIGHDYGHTNSRVHGCPLDTTSYSNDQRRNSLPGWTPESRRKGLGTYASYQALFMSNLPHDVAMFNEYHALLVRHGKDVCKKKPICIGCCLATACASAGVG